jgi:GR25 family glycosyltransferase involved in LPS biosynthesis
MKAYAITIAGNAISEKGTEGLIHSSKVNGNGFKIEVFNAVVPSMVKSVMGGNGLKWNYPWSGQENDIKSGLVKSAYQTANPDNRIACFLSHWLLWNKCNKINEPILVLEHDAMFVEKLDYEKIIESKFDIIGINSPASATRRAHVFHDIVHKSTTDILPVPTVDEFNVPQGLAGNSAYIIKPNGAKNVLQAVKEYGCWPNDAIMCKQLVPNMGVTKKYYTQVQGLPSTTVK